MKPSSVADTRMSTLYIAASGLLVLVATLGIASAASLESKSPQAEVATAAAAQQVAATSGQEQDHLALASSSGSQSRLMPISHKESVSSTTTSMRSSDLSVGQSNIAHAKVHSSPQDMATAAGSHYGGHGKGHGKYYMYVEVPKKGAHKMGYKRGNHKHEIEGKESAHKGHVSGYVKWHDKKGKGSHKYELMHYEKKGKHYG